MNVPIPRREPTGAPSESQARARADAPVQPQVDTPLLLRKASTNCRACGKPWFGEVTYCPYCGRASGAGAATPAAARARHPERPASAGKLTPALARHVRSLAERLRSYAGGKPSSARDTPSSAGAARPSADKPRATVPDGFARPRPSAAPAPGLTWRHWVTPVALALVIAAVTFAIGEFASRSANRSAPYGEMGASAGDAAPQGTVDASAANPATATPAAPRADAQPAAPQEPPAPMPGRNRALCSVANEAAGLCSAQ